MNAKDTQTLSAIRADLESALSAVEKKHGIELEVGAMSYRYSGESLSRASFVVRPTRRLGWGRNRNYWPPALRSLEVGDRLTIGGQEYTFRGSNPKARTRPLILEANGKLYSFKTADIVAAIES